MFEKKNYLAEVFKKLISAFQQEGVNADSVQPSKQL
jgi:hypothetical protein